MNTPPGNGGGDEGVALMRLHARISMLTPAAIVAGALCFGTGALAAEPEGSGQATLTMDVRKLDFEGNKRAGLMYMPSSATLVAERPANISKEPTYVGTPKYATIRVGSGKNNVFALAFDEPEGADAKVYADLNGNGDLTDDGDGAWAEKSEREGQSPSYQSTLVFQTSWKNDAGGETRGEYALNMYRSPDRATVNYYRASARVGKIDISGKTYEVMLIENDGDGVFNKLYDPSVPTEAEKLPKPVTLTLDGDRFDIRGTFGFGEYNYVARVSDDGSKLTMEPTMKQIRLPRPTERPQMLGKGGPVPDFEAVWWVAGASAEDEPKVFKISDFRGKKIVVLDLWATWCGPCMRGIPHLSKIAESVKGQDVEVIALNVWDEKRAFERWAGEKGKDYAFKIARDPAGKEPRDASVAARIFKLSGIPAQYVIDKDGKIVEVVSGYREGDRQLEHALVRLGVKIEGIKPEDAETKPAIKAIPATGMR